MSAVDLARANTRSEPRSVSVRFIELEFSRDDKEPSPSSVHRDAGVCPSQKRRRLTRPCGGRSADCKGDVMIGRVMMILASAALAGSLLATDAQARGGGGGGGGHGGGGGGHMGGGFGGGHIGGFVGRHVRRFGGGHVGGFCG